MLDVETVLNVDTPVAVLTLPIKNPIVFPVRFPVTFPANPEDAVI